MSVASSLVAFLFIGLAIAEIAEFFANDESFSGIMMIARPIAVLAMVLLCVPAPPLQLPGSRLALMAATIWNRPTLRQNE